MEKYSVLMSVYIKTVPKQLSEATDSMLHQTLPPEQFVLVCDGQVTQSVSDVIEAYQRRFPELFTVVRLLDAEYEQSRGERERHPDRAAEAAAVRCEEHALRLDLFCSLGDIFVVDVFECVKQTLVA